MTSFRANKPQQLAARCAMPLLVAAMMVLGGARAARAHQDPSTCTHPGVAIEFSTFRSDGVTPIGGTDTVSPCETIVYQVKLSKQNDPSVCAFEAGKIFITTADGVQHDVTPTTGIPCVGGTTSPCDPAVVAVFSQKLSFTINQPSGQVGATANYGLPVNGVCQPNSSCGTEHNSPSDLLNVVSAGLASATAIVPCPASTPCLTSLCDPSATEQIPTGGTRTGVCVTQNVTDSTPCAADNAGNPVTAIPGSCKTPGCEAGECVRAHINVTDSTACSADNAGNPVNAIPGACKTPGCEAGVCVTQHISVTDSTACSVDNAGNPVTAVPGSCKTPGCEAGQCVSAHINVTDSTACTDTDNNACTTAGCEGGVCVQTHIGPPTCANPVCQECNPATGVCENKTPQPPECVQLLGCRVTGGGTVDACGPDHSACDPNTPGACAPDTCSSPAFEAIDATHGGQVGAPIGVATPFTPDSACIAGEWTHVRHIKKGLNGNFHARSFDSLECACLPCPENPDAPGVVGSLCNPGDRICGPEPRRAPANKICFSGPGDYALTNGKRAKRSVVFRVDVEDRSEPGGTNGPPPPDRYRMRIWFVDPDTSDGLTLRQAVACADPTTETITAPTPDIDDGGDLFRGNQQIHPPLKKTCP